MRVIAVALLAAFGACVAQAHDPITTNITWSKEISRLVYKRCASCHRDGGAAFSLMSYEVARPWAVAIKDETLARRMPPWQAVKGFGQFHDDRGLTQEELDLIADWVDGGAPEGDPKYLPAVPKPVAWMDPAMPAGASEMVVSANMKLPSTVRVVAVRPKDLKPGATVQIVAVRPDGGIEPLLWLYEYKPAFQRTYYYLDPIALPAGTRIEMNPADAGTVGLFTKNSVRAAIKPRP